MNNFPLLAQEVRAFHSNLAPLNDLVARIRQVGDFGFALAEILSLQLDGPLATASSLAALFGQTIRENPSILEAAARDLQAVTARDPAADGLLRPFLFFKGFHAIQTHRIAHAMWLADQRDTALFLQNRSSIVFGVDIHPAAKLGSGLMMDHATGVVIGETAVVEDDVSMLHAVTLGGTGNEQGDRHPKVRRGVMIGAGTKILGNIEIGEGACIAAGSVVLKSVPPHVTVAGVPAQIIGTPRAAVPAEAMDQMVVD